jgi:chemotaxis family two-component system response regulator Rcp1
VSAAGQMRFPLRERGGTFAHQGMADYERLRVAEILLVEDNPGDVRLMREAFHEVATPHRLNVVGTGGEALRYLRREEGHAAAPRPDLVLLDLTLPDIPGMEVLAAMKGDAALRRIPAVVFSSSQVREEVVDAYNLNANSFIAKPADRTEYLRVVKGMEEFWLTVVKLPKE